MLFSLDSEAIYLMLAAFIESSVSPALDVLDEGDEQSSSHSIFR